MDKVIEQNQTLENVIEEVKCIKKSVDNVKSILSCSEEMASNIFIIGMMNELIETISDRCGVVDMSLDDIKDAILLLSHIVREMDSPHVEYIE